MRAASLLKEYYGNINYSLNPHQQYFVGMASAYKPGNKRPASNLHTLQLIPKQLFKNAYRNSLRKISLYLVNANMVLF
jgi:hypothetical protein